MSTTTHGDDDDDVRLQQRHTSSGPLGKLNLFVNYLCFNTTTTGLRLVNDAQQRPHQHRRAMSTSHEAYKAASEVAVTKLPPTHPIRLDLALNFSVEARSDTSHCIWITYIEIKIYIYLNNVLAICCVLSQSKPVVGPD